MSGSALASFYAQTRQDNQSKLAATYLVSGEIEPESKQPDRMDIDEENAEDKDAEYEDDGDEQVETTEVVLVGEQDLERVLLFSALAYSFLKLTLFFVCLL